MARLIDPIVGQSGAWNALMDQRSRDRMPHALAFVGPAGVGKRMVAWALAQALVCERDVKPCGECGPCRRVESHQSESVLFIEPVNGVIKLEAAQHVLQFFKLQRIGRARVVIVDEAQALNPQAGNSLLKMIEEPPEQTYFLLIVSEISQLLPTLRSRVQVVRFAPLSEAQLAAQAEPGVAPWMVRSARGSFEQLAAFRDSHSDELRALTLEFLAQALKGRRDGLAPLLEQAKERESALAIVHILQQLLRDWSLSEGGEKIHSDLNLSFPPAPEEKRTQLWRSAFQMELDLASHVDKSLLFENFFYRARAVLS